ncbi:hypothetical protein [Staphylococcus phage ZCSS1]|uniref:Uncharacterized protein n=1 Tax=Staphylococcus phage UHP46 TaxID=3234966 RepID=A0AB39C816_9CAUD|nr:hypothetical protein [Staphylococcus phage ZCSS1]
MILTTICLLMIASLFLYLISFILVMTFEKELYEKMFTISAFAGVIFSMTFMISLIITYGI